LSENVLGVASPHNMSVTLYLCEDQNVD